MIYKAIEELTTVVTGGTPSTSKAEYWEDGNIPWLQSGCCQNCDVNQADKFITQSGYDNSSTQLMPVNTVMIALTGATAGKVGYLNIEACGNQSITGIFPCDELNSRFLFYFLVSQRKRILADCVGGAQAHISQGYVKKIKVPVYSRSIQDRIVDIMNICSKSIIHYEMMLKEYDELIKARFIEMFGDLKSNEKDWDLKTFEEMSVLITDGEHSTPKRTKEGIYLLSARNILNHSLQLKDVDYINRDEYLRIAKRVVPKKGDILISCSGTIGRCCSVPDSLQLQMVRSVALIRFKEVINPIFAEYMITSDYLQEQINSSKTMSSQANLFQGKIRKLKGFLPPTELQQQFADFVRQVDKSRFNIKKSIIEIEREVVYD